MNTPRASGRSACSCVSRAALRRSARSGRSEKPRSRGDSPGAPSTSRRAPWGVAVRKGEPALAALMSGMVVKWHLSGRIIELEQKYGLEPTPFAQKMHELFLGVNPTIAR